MTIGASAGMIHAKLLDHAGTAQELLFDEAVIHAAARSCRESVIGHKRLLLSSSSAGIGGATTILSFAFPVLSGNSTLQVELLNADGSVSNTLSVSVQPDLSIVGGVSGSGLSQLDSSSADG